MRVVSSSSIDIHSSPVLVTGLVGIEGHAILAWSGNIEAGVEPPRSESLIAISGHPPMINFSLTFATECNLARRLRDLKANVRLMLALHRSLSPPS